MNRTTEIKKSLVNVDDSVLVVIDIQAAFLEKFGTEAGRSLVEKSVWIIEVAKHLRVPIVAMAEDIDNTGNLHPAIHQALPKGTTVFSKDFFGLAGNPEILAAVASTERKTAVLIGTETDVCVAQSALGLMDNGYHVVVLKDAVGTTEGDADIGFSRMRDAGAVVSSVKALFYEWMRSVKNCDKLRAEAPQLQSGLKPDSLVL